MSGHSKWAGIKHKKALVDAQKGKIFSRLSREIAVAARHGGGSIETNARLRLAVSRAREANMPTDNVERAIKKGTGELPGVTYEEVIYEGFAPHGVAILVEAMTDNKNRTTAEIRTIFSKRNGNLSGPGSVSRLFQKKGYILVNVSAAAEEKVMDIVLEAGAEDMKTETDNYEIITGIDKFEAVKKALQDSQIPVKSAELTLIPLTTVRLGEKDQAKVVLGLMEALEDLDDVQNVAANFDIPDDILKAIT